MKYTVHVTHEDIKKGNKTEPHSCPVNRALERTLGKNTTTGVHEFDVHGRKFPFSRFLRFTLRRKPVQTIKLPFEASKFIVDFDTGRKVDPFIFEVEV